MWKEMQALPPDGRQSETALMIARGVRRLLRARGFSSVTELALTDGRRADIEAVNRDGEVIIVEVKSSPTDFRADRKWREYASSWPTLMARRLCAKPSSGAWRQRAVGLFYCALAWRRQTGCIVWRIRALCWSTAERKGRH